ncbi:hypothetical protein ACFQ48_13645 [Hymenobacter caeli]|uniref:Outer membrane protein beta-barrel domain-containing protein n=1 Tax=Hymenobacter caeli TaxID=2735894 RepID=A0ABX2FT23_9BACT|nr:hypothetical protein [Hymenobacter caeli]NRT20340.1 hypothetical protein [Hymenobacter caeli]
MKKILLLLPLLALAKPAAAQHVEFSGRAGLGLLRFDGNGAAATTLAADQDNDGSTAGDFTINPVGKRAGFGFGASIRAQHVGGRGLLAALEVGYDRLQSQTDVTGYYPFYDTGFPPNAASGTTKLRVQSVPIFAGIGQRVGKAGAVQLDAVIGPEWAVLWGAREKGQGSYTTLGPAGTWQTDNAVQLTKKHDFRLRADLTAWYHRLGLTASYALGLTALRSESAYVSDEDARSRTLRLGVAYRLP